MKRIIITENQKKRLLQEYYNSPIYHFTDLYSALRILKSNTICLDYDGEGAEAKNHKNEPFVSFSRYKGVDAGYQSDIMNSVRFTILPTALHNNVRHAKLSPFNYDWSNTTKDINFEFEERFYGGDIPLKKCCIRIDIFIKDLEHMDYRCQYVYDDDQSGEYKKDEPFEEGNKKLIEDIVFLAEQLNIFIQVHRI